MKNTRTWLILVLIVICAILTNPTKDDFSGWVKFQLKNHKSGGLFNDFTLAVAENFITPATTQRNFALFSSFEFNGIHFLGIFNQFYNISGFYVKNYPSNNAELKATPKPTPIQPTPTPYSPTPEPQKITAKSNYEAMQRKDGIERVEGISYERHTDLSYGYTYLYPSVMISAESPTYYKEGQKYVSKSKDAEMVVFPYHGINMQEILEILSDGFDGEFTYKAVGETWCAFSFLRGNRSLYIKLNLIDNSFIRVFTFEFPDSQKDIYSQNIEVIEDSLKQISNSAIKSY